MIRRLITPFKYYTRLPNPSLFRLAFFKIFHSGIDIFKSIFLNKPVEIIRFGLALQALAWIPEGHCHPGL
jgi:hypothetical protein